MKNVETLAAFFERRNLLQDLAAKLDGNDALQASLQKMLFPTGDSVSELDALRKAYKEALASVDAARDAVSKAGEDQEKQKAAEEGVQQAETAASEAKKKLDEKRKAKRPDTEAIAAAMVRNSGDPDEDKRQREVADARLAACLAEHEDNPFTLPASGSMLGMLTERWPARTSSLRASSTPFYMPRHSRSLKPFGVAFIIWCSTRRRSDRLKLRLFNASFKELRTDLERAVEFDQSLLFKRVYEEEYGTFGGEPYSCLLHVHEYGLSAVDLGVLQKMAEVAAAAHTPCSVPRRRSFSGWGASPICPCHAICTRFSRARTISNGVRSARRTIPAM